ncbi:hypothetical protein Tco_0323065 [Tanacetum coccineum]
MERKSRRLKNKGKSEAITIFSKDLQDAEYEKRKLIKGKGIMMNESNHDLIADDDFMTPTKNLGLRITDDAMCELAKPNYVTNQFATHIGDDVDTKNTITFRASPNVLKFVLDVTNDVMGESIKMGTANYQFMSSIKSIKDVDNMDWCGYIVECLKKTKTNWNGRGNFNGPMTFLALFYVHSTTMRKVKEIRNIPAIWYWNSKMLRKREKEDLESGGFALKPWLDLGKKKENHVRDTNTIGRMRYADEIRAETSIKVEKDVVECITTKVDSHKDANTSGIRKLEIMPCESNSEPNDDVWGALLLASKSYGNTNLVKVDADNLFNLDLKHTGYYVLST